MLFYSATLKKKVLKMTANLFAHDCTAVATERDSLKKQLKAMKKELFDLNIERDLIHAALDDAVKSLNTVAVQSGMDEYMYTIPEIRSYASWRASASASLYDMFNHKKGSSNE